MLSEHWMTNDTPSTDNLCDAMASYCLRLSMVKYYKDDVMSIEKIEQLERELLEEFAKLWLDLESDANRNHVLLAEMESSDFAAQRQKIRDMIESGELVLPGIND